MLGKPGCWVAAVLVLSLTGCWTQFRGNATRTGYQPEESALGPGQSKTSRPELDGNHGWRGRLVAGVVTEQHGLRRLAGRQCLRVQHRHGRGGLVDPDRWRGRLVAGGVTEQRDLRRVGGPQALGARREHGRPKVDRDPRVALIASSPTLAGANVYTGSDDGKLYAFDATTGAPVWSTATGGPVRSSPAISGSTLYCRFQ